MYALSHPEHGAVASGTIPVSPMPPAVAQNSAGSSSGDSSTTPVGVASDIRSTDAG